MKIVAVGARFAMLFWFLMATPVHAILLDVVFHDSDGVYWTGQVDTTADTLRIDLWQGNLGSTTFWSPHSSELPMLWTAVDAGHIVDTPTTYDVPDTFDGTDMTGWGFLSPFDASAIFWNEGMYLHGSHFPVVPGWGVLPIGAGCLTRHPATLAQCL